MQRAPGLSVRLKLTLSYAGFLMLAGLLLLVAGYFSLSRGVHPGVIFLVRSHADLLRALAPTAGIVLAFLLVFGLVGGWLLAGRMLAPLDRITDATRTAASGPLPPRPPPPRPGGDRSRIGSACRAAATSSASSPTPSTPCSSGSRHRSPNSSGS